MMLKVHFSLAQSFIIDPDDPVYHVNNIFTQEELEEIRNFNKKSLPKPPSRLVDFLLTFGRVV